MRNRTLRHLACHPPIALAWVALSLLLPATTTADLLSGSTLAPEHLAVLATADPRASDMERLLAECAECHGSEGISTTESIPHLAGQNRRYLYKQLMDFASEQRHGRRMNEIASALSAQQMANLAAYYAAGFLPGTQKTPRPTDPTLVTGGDPARGIDACARCHGGDGRGRLGEYESPALAGMPFRYFVKAMRSFSSGARVNDPNDAMWHVAQALTADEIELLADYYLALGSRPRMPEVRSIEAREQLAAASANN